MRGTRKTLLALLLALVMTLGCGTASAFAAVSSEELSAAVNDTAAYVYQTVQNPQVGSIGGEWAVLGLARSGYEAPEKYYQDYYRTVEEYVKASSGVLHDKKYTEYSRLIVALTSIGKDPRNVAGYNLLTPLGDYDKTVWQGLNGPIWALIALDSGNYEMPVNKEAKTQATRDMYIDRILACQLQDGGFSLFGGTEAASKDEKSDPDITGMALQALAKYQDRAEVKRVIDEALDCMSKQQDAAAGYSSWGTANSESCVQMIVALNELGISLDDTRFVKNGKNMLDNLMTFYQKGKGFQHTADGSGSNQMATEQGLYCLVSAQRALQQKNSLYRMSDALKISMPTTDGSGERGLPGRNEDVKPSGIIYPGRTFDDVQAHRNQPAIESLASRGIINGKTDAAFEPEATMTRAEFATIVVNALGLTPKENSKFIDVPQSKWYAPYVGTANTYGIVSGTTDTTFNPEGTINRQEAAVMVAKAAALCGMAPEMTEAEARDIISQFGDYVESASWARTSLAFCYSQGILDQSDDSIRPKEAIKRCEIAEMIYRMLGKAELL